MAQPAEFVRTVQHGESLESLIEESKALAWTSNAEHAILKLSSKERIIVRGGPDGIEFLLNAEETQVFVTMRGLRLQVVRIYFHTHPRVTGPSDDDLKVLRILSQSRSYIFEIGGDRRGTLIRPR